MAEDGVISAHFCALESNCSGGERYPAAPMTQHNDQSAEEERTQQERALHSLEELSSNTTRAAVTESALGLGPLSVVAPALFNEMVQDFGLILDLALEERAYKVDHDIHRKLRALSDRLGFLNAGPRDVIEVYSAALRQRTSLATPRKAKVYAQEGQLMALETMGYLAAYYRHYAAVPARSLVAEADLNGREGDRGGR